MLQQSKKPDISVIVPAYNEERNIGEVLRRLMKIDWPLDRMEIVLVDDGSTDHTSQVVAGFPFVKHIRHEINQGKGAALSTGIRNSTGRVLVIQDADMEYPPECIPRLVEPIFVGKVDVVFGSRFRGSHQGMTISHIVGNRILSVVASFLYNVSITDVMTGHKAFRREVLDSFELESKGFGVEVEMISKSLRHGWKFEETPIDYAYRCFGVSKIAYLDGVKSLVRLIVEKVKPIPSH